MSNFILTISKTKIEFLKKLHCASWIISSMYWWLLYISEDTSRGNPFCSHIHTSLMSPRSLRYLSNWDIYIRELRFLLKMMLVYQSYGQLLFDSSCPMLWIMTSNTQTESDWNHCFQQWPAGTEKHGGEGGIDQKGEKQNLRASTWAEGRLWLGAKYKKQNIRKRQRSG